MNIKKIGLTALAGSLVATSAFAGEMSVAGGASITVEHKNGTAADSGKSTWTPTVSNGAVTMNIINSTSITSTNGVTFISLMGSFFERFIIKAIKIKL